MGQLHSQNLSHEQFKGTFEEAKLAIAEKIQARGDLPYTSVDKQLEYLEQLSQFDLGRFLIERGGLNGYWTHHIITHPQKGRLSGLNQHNTPFHLLEKFLLDEAPVCLATQQRFSIFKKLIQEYLHEGCALASIPCGLMGDLLDLDYSSLTMYKLYGIDLDAETLSQALIYAEEKNLASHCIFMKNDAWNLPANLSLDLIASNGLNIYEPSDEKVVELYRQFFNCLKPEGVLITSFLTPPPLPGMKSEWLTDRVSGKNALLQKIIMGDILSTKWQIYRTEETVKNQLEQAGFHNIEIFYDEAHIFPTVVAKKPT